MTLTCVKSLTLVILFVCFTAGCQRSVTMELVPRGDASVELGETLDLGVNVHGPTDGYLYRWKALQGTCDPQISTLPKTTYISRGVGEDRVTVELVRDETSDPVATAELSIGVVEQHVTNKNLEV